MSRAGRVGPSTDAAASVLARSDGDTPYARGRQARTVGPAGGNARSNSRASCDSGLRAEAAQGLPRALFHLPRAHSSRARADRESSPSRTAAASAPWTASTSAAQPAHSPV